MSVLDRPIRRKAHTAARPRVPAGLTARPAAAALAVVALVIVALAALIPLMQDSSATARGYGLRDLERTRDEWRARNDALEQEVAELGSIERVRREATERLGMVAPGQTIYIKTDVSGPSAGEVPERYLPGQPEGPDHERSAPLWERFLAALKP